MASALLRTFAALGDPVRFGIVQRLAESDATVGELAGMFEISIQGVPCDSPSVTSTRLCG